MIQTSETYNPYTTVRDIDMIVTYPVLSPTAASHASYTVTDAHSISDLSQLNNLNYTNTKYATCEDGMTMLDGSFRFLPDVLSNEQIGWWTNELSRYNATVPSQNGTFETAQKLTATLSQRDTVVGFTIYSAKTNVIKECTVAVYDGQDKLFEEVFYSSNEEMVIELPVSDFNKVEVFNIKMALPYRRIKILSFSFGITKRWNRNSIVSATVEELSDYTGNTFPINTLTVEFDNSTHEFDLFGATRQFVYRAATNNANVTAENANEVSGISQIKNIDSAIYNYATCEDGLTLLNGKYGYVSYYSWSSVPSNQVGFVNNVVSDSNGDFSATPSVSYNWNSEINVSGFKLFFHKSNYATSVTVTAYNDNTVIDTKTVQNNDSILDIEFTVSGCDKITFTFGGVAEENRFVKVSKIQVLRYVDSWGSYLTKRQKVIAEFVINGEHVSVGNSYLFNELKQINGGLTAEITAKSDTVYLDAQNHEGEHGTTTLGTAINSVLDGTEISASYSPASLANTTVSKATPKDTTKRAATHYFAQAAKATCFFDRDGVLNIKSLESSEYVDEIDITNIYDKDIARMGEYVNMVRLTVKDEYVDPETSNTYYGGSGLYYRELENDCVYAGNGTAVAEWLLRQYERRVYFEIESQGNPALELGDTIKITTADGIKYIAIIYEQKFSYGNNGGLKCTIKAVEATRN